MINIYIFISIALISIISLIGIISLSIKKEKLQNLTIYLVAFSAGALLGDAFLHLLPEATEEKTIIPWITVLSGIIIFFILEKIIQWRHCHIITSKDHPHPVGIMNLIGDGLHNLLDGMVIAGAYLVSIPIGIATTLAVIAHEIPQEISDFGVLIHAGYSRRKALLFNLFSALLAFIGALIVMIIGNIIESVSKYIIALTAGGFIYIASSDLIPELHKEISPKKSLKQLLSFSIGTVLMFIFIFFE